MPRKKAKTPPREWAYQGVECYVSRIRRRRHEYHSFDPREPNERPRGCWVRREPLRGHVPLYQLRHKSRRDRCYCVTIEDLRGQQARGYRAPRRVGYVMLNQDSEHVPLMRTVSRVTKRHYYTTNVKKVDKYAPTIRDGVLVEMSNKIFPMKPGVQPQTLDYEYFCPSLRAARQIIANSGVAERKRSENALDCDEYAHLLKTAFIEDACNIYDIQSALRPQRSMPYAFGVICGRDAQTQWRHYMNVLVTSEGAPGDYRFWLVEPQTGMVLRASRRYFEQVSFLVF